MDIYLTGHLALAFGIFAKNLPINQSIIQNQFIHLSNPSFFFVLGLKQRPKKISEIFLPYLFCPRLPLTIIPNTPIRDK